MESAALSLLEAPVARRIAAAWPSIFRELNGRPRVKLVPEWCERAQATEEDIEAVLPGMFALGVLDEKRGTIDPTAEKFIVAAAFAAAAVRPVRGGKSAS